MAFAIADHGSIIFLYASLFAGDDVITGRDTHVCHKETHEGSTNLIHVDRGGRVAIYQSDGTGDE